MHRSVHCCFIFFCLLLSASVIRISFLFGRLRATVRSLSFRLRRSPLAVGIYRNSSRMARLPHAWGVGASIRGVGYIYRLIYFCFE